MRYAAFLRAINVGGRRLTNDQLRVPFEQLGLEDVATYRASGNVVFSADAGQPRAELGFAIEHQLEADLGYEVPVFLRDADEVNEISGQEPFGADRLEASKGKLQVALLDGEPGEAARGAALELATDDDGLSISEAELYWLPSAGTQDSLLDIDELARILGPLTMRTMGTMENIAKKFFS